MASYLQNRYVYDRIRKRWVEASPEEVVRQALVHQMLEELGYPEHLIAIEKSVSQLACVPGSASQGRVDLLCFHGDLHTPLLLIECKAIPIRENMFAQMFGYNASIRAPFTCLANRERVILGWMDENDYRYHLGLPPYAQLIRCLKENASSAM